MTINFARIAESDYPTQRAILFALTGVGANDLTRMCDKLHWSLDHGWRPQAGYEAENILLFATLTEDEERMSDSRFQKYLEATWPKEPIEPVRLLSKGDSRKPQIRCTSGSKCLRAYRRLAPYAPPGHKFCSTACCASHRARHRRCLASILDAQSAGDASETRMNSGLEEGSMQKWDHTPSRSNFVTLEGPEQAALPAVQHEGGL